MIEVKKQAVSSSLVPSPIRMGPGNEATMSSRFLYIETQHIITLPWSLPTPGTNGAPWVPWCSWNPRTDRGSW